MFLIVVGILVAGFGFMGVKAITTHSAPAQHEAMSPKQRVLVDPTLVVHRDEKRRAD